MHKKPSKNFSRSSKILSIEPNRDIFFEPFSGTGPGGQNRNKKAKCVRLSHPASGTAVTATRERSLEQNKKAALHQLVKHPKFKSWLRIEIAARLEGYRSVEDKVNQEMKKIKIERYKDGEWVELSKD